MKRLALIAATGVFALTLSACGEQGPKPTVVTTPEHQVVQPAEPTPTTPTPTPEQHPTEGQNQ